MQRPIKFRAWDKKTKEMLEISEAIFINGEIADYHAVGDSVISGWRGNDVVMQYTGLKDKNGVEIYEGDIVGLIHEKHGLVNSRVIIWDKDNACFDWENANGDSWPDGFTGFIDEYEVIGTIYENPELLNAQ